MKKTFRFLRELAWMAARLFERVPSDNELRLHHSEFFPSSDFAYLMWCGHLVYRDEKLAQISPVALNHERIHLCQARAKGSWFRFYVSYLWESLRGWGIGGPHLAAYYTNPYEMEAYANERVMGYCAYYNPDNLRCYRLRHRRRTFANRKSDWRVLLEELRRKSVR